MTEPSSTKLNQLEQALPQGMLVDAAWLERRGYSTSLRSQYVRSGWLERPVRGVYKRVLGEVTWERTVTSLQHLMGYSVHVGGRTALEVQGFAHFISPIQTREVELYSDAQLPGWLNRLPIEQSFVVQRPSKLFRLDQLEPGSVRGLDDEPCPLLTATPARAWLEMLERVPKHETFEHADMVGESLRTLSPVRMQNLLEACKSVKAKRLALWFAERHGHPWRRQIQVDRLDLGSGKRALVPGGRLDPTYLITTPRDLDVGQ